MELPYCRVCDAHGNLVSLGKACWGGRKDIECVAGSNLLRFLL